MTIIIKQDQVNMLIYKYLLESGLKHTAFSLFNEASLDKVDVSIQKVAPKMLISYLEKALIFSQIETHIYKDEHIDCKGSFELLVPHQCKTTDLKKQELASRINQFHHDLEPILNEDDTNSSIATRIKVTNENISQISLSQKSDTVAVYGENDEHISLWKIKLDSETNKTTLRPSGVIDFNCLESKKEDFVCFQWDATEEYLLLAFRDGKLYFFDSNNELKTLLNVQPGFQKEGITWNPFSNELLSIRYEENYLIINPMQAKVQTNKDEKIKSLVWQNSKNYAVLTNEDMIYLYENENDMSIQSFMADENTQKIKFSNNALFLASFSSKSNSIKVWTMNSKHCLYSFMDNYSIKDFVWSSHEDSTPGFFNFIIVIFQNSIKLFDIEYGEVKNTIELDDRDTYVLLTQEDGSISIYSLYTSNSNSKRLHHVPGNGEIKQL